MTLKEITKIRNNEGLIEYLRNNKIFDFPSIDLNNEEIINEIDKRMARSGSLAKYIICLIFKNSDQRNSVMQELNLTELTAQEKHRCSKDPIFSPEYWYSGIYCKISDNTKLSDIILSEKEEAALDHLNIDDRNISIKELRKQLEIIRYQTEHKSDIAEIENLGVINITNYCNIYPCNLLKDVYTNTPITLQQATNAIAFSETLSFLYDEMIKNPPFTDRHRMVIEKRYKENKTLYQIGNELGVSAEVVRTNISKAQRFMREPSRSKCIKTILQLDMADSGTVTAINKYIIDKNTKSSKIINILANDKMSDAINLICNSELIKTISIVDENDILKIFMGFNGTTDMEKLLLSAKYHSGDYPAKMCSISVNNENRVFSLETDIEELGFSVRSYSCLKRAGVYTIKDLLDLMCSYRDEDGEPDPIDALMHVRNLGRRSMEEVMEVMSSLKMI